METSPKIAAAQSTETGPNVEPFDLKEAGAYASFNIHSFPDIPPNSQIIGICALTKEDVLPEKHGWIVSDTLAFKQLMFKEGNKDSQIWLSLSDIANVFSDAKAMYAHMEGVEPSSQPGMNQIRAKDVSAAVSGLPHFQVHSTLDQLHTTVVKEIRERSKLALKNNTALVILGMGLSNASQDLIVGSFNQVIYKERLSRVAGNQAPVILVTPAPFSGGWQVNAELGKKYEAISDDARKKYMAMLCKSSFVPRGQAISGETDFGAPDAAGIEKGAAQSFTHILNFDPRCDEWEKIWAKRVGAPLTYWQRKWYTFPAAGFTKKSDGYDFLGTAFGGSRSSQLAHVTFLVAQELEACPGDWEKSFVSSAKDILQVFLEKKSGDIAEKDVKEVMDLLDARASAILMADMIRSLLSLPRPQEKDCRHWNYKMHLEVIEHDVLLRNSFTSAWSTMLALWPGAPYPPSMSGKTKTDTRCYRPTFYLAACVATKFVINEGNYDIASINEYVKVQLGAAIAMISDELATQAKIAREATERQAKEAAERKAKETAEREAKEAAERQAREAAERKAKEAAGLEAKEAAIIKAASERKARETSIAEKVALTMEAAIARKTAERQVPVALKEDHVSKSISIPELKPKNVPESVAKHVARKSPPRTLQNSRWNDDAATLTKAPVDHSAEKITTSGNVPNLPQKSVQDSIEVSTAALPKMVQGRTTANKELLNATIKDLVKKELSEQGNDLSDIITAFEKTIRLSDLPKVTPSVLAPIASTPQKSAGPVSSSTFTSPPTTNQAPHITIQPPTPVSVANLSSQQTREGIVGKGAEFESNEDMESAQVTTKPKASAAVREPSFASMVDNVVQSTPGLASISKEALATIFSSIAEGLRQSAIEDSK